EVELLRLSNEPPARSLQSFLPVDRRALELHPQPLGYVGLHSAQQQDGWLVVDGRVVADLEPTVLAVWIGKPNRQGRIERANLPSLRVDGRPGEKLLSVRFEVEVRPLERPAKPQRPVDVAVDAQLGNLRHSPR